MTAPGPGQPGAAAPGPAAERISAAYTELFGSVPASIETRLALAEQTGRLEAVEAIEAPRRVLILDNPLGRKTGQLVHFAQLIAVGKAEPVRLHARAARKAGASLVSWPAPPSWLPSPPGCLPTVSAWRSSPRRPQQRRRARLPVRQPRVPGPRPP